MSLTTAVSDDEVDGESAHSNNSPYKSGGGNMGGTVVGAGGGVKGGSAASFNCTGAVRKAGFLSVKKWLLRKKHQVRTIEYVCAYMCSDMIEFGNGT